MLFYFKGKIEYLRVKLIQSIRIFKTPYGIKG